MGLLLQLDLRALGPLPGVRYPPTRVRRDVRYPPTRMRCDVRYPATRVRCDVQYKPSVWCYPPTHALWNVRTDPAYGSTMLTVLTGRMALRPGRACESGCTSPRCTSAVAMSGTDLAYGATAFALFAMGCHAGARRQVPPPACWWLATRCPVLA
eukprot:1566720-Rhodomonas_salina.4